MSEYIPRAGDIVHFPQAPRSSNRNRPYEISAADIDRELPGGGYVAFHLRGEDYIYTKKFAELQAIGMTLYKSVDDNDPVKGEE